MSFYIQIGAGVGDLDYCADYRDGFSSHVKSIPKRNALEILVVEANSLNISLLRKSWEATAGVKVFNLAITPYDVAENTFIDFYFAPEDAPFYQIASVKEAHVRKNFPHSILEVFSVPTIGINQFLDKYVPTGNVELLALDIEGIDSDVIMAIDFHRFDIHQLSFEKTHAGPEIRDLRRRLRSFGYIQSGTGMDPHNSDVLWVKPRNKLESLRLSLRHVKHRAWEIQIPIRHFLKSKYRKFS